MARRTRGFSKLDLIAIAGIIVLIGVFVLPRLQGLRMSHNEEDALHALQVLRGRMIALKESRLGPPPSAQLSIEELLSVNPGERPFLDDCRFEPAGDGAAVLHRHGYLFAIVYGSSERIAARTGYVIYAWPESYDETGTAVFAAPAPGKFWRARNLAARYSGLGRKPELLAQFVLDNEMGTAPSGGKNQTSPSPEETLRWEEISPPE